MTAIIDAGDLTLRYGQRVVFEHLNFAVVSGRVTALIGPNGAGKSSLLRLLAGVQRPSAGAVTTAGPVSLIVPQVNPPADVTPRELASYGPALARPWFKIFESAHDRETVAAALARAGLAQRADDPVTQLSDGEIQRAWLAAALAVSPRAILIDEPTSHLDLRYQVEVMHLLLEFARSGVAVCAAIHDLTLAGRFAHTIALLAGGSLVIGPPEEVLEAAALSRAFGVPISTHTDPAGGHVVCLAR